MEFAPDPRDPPADEDPRSPGTQLEAANDQRGIGNKCRVSARKDVAVAGNLKICARAHVAGGSCHWRSCVMARRRAAAAPRATVAATASAAPRARSAAARPRRGVPPRAEAAEPYTRGESWSACMKCHAVSPGLRVGALGSLCAWDWRITLQG
jgi:hypothetical protein